MLEDPRPCKSFALHSYTMHELQNLICIYERCNSQIMKLYLHTNLCLQPVYSPVTVIVFSSVFIALDHCRAFCLAPYMPL